MEINQIQSMVQQIVRDLVDRNYEKVVLGDCQKQLTPGEISQAIKDYGGIITDPPAQSFEDLEIYEISKNEIAFAFDLWFDNMKSDLTLGGTIITDGDLLKYSIDNIHVL